MVLSFDEVIPVLEQYRKEYFQQEPYSEYMNCCALSDLNIMRKRFKENFKLRPEDSLEDLCISVRFWKAPPKELGFPLEYKGVRVFYKLIAGDLDW